MKNHHIVLYTHPGCPGGRRCSQFLNDQRLAYTEKDIACSSEARKEFQERGFIVTPTIMVDQKIFVGFDQQEFSAYLNQGGRDTEEE